MSSSPVFNDAQLQHITKSAKTTKTRATSILISRKTSNEKNIPSVFSCRHPPEVCCYIVMPELINIKIFINIVRCAVTPPSSQVSPHINDVQSTIIVLTFIVKSTCFKTSIFEFISRAFKYSSSFCHDFFFDHFSNRQTVIELGFPIGSFELKLMTAKTRELLCKFELRNPNHW